MIFSRSPSRQMFSLARETFLLHPCSTSNAFYVNFMIVLQNTKLSSKTFAFVINGDDVDVLRVEIPFENLLFFLSLPPQPTCWLDFVIISRKLFFIRVGTRLHDFCHIITIVKSEFIER